MIQLIRVPECAVEFSRNRGIVRYGVLKYLTADAARAEPWWNSDAILPAIRV
jgi:hypothetical protein